MNSKNVNYVILDCDGGSDDAWALLLLLKADAQKHIKLLAVSICGNGNTTLQYASRNMQLILKAYNREEVSELIEKTNNKSYSEYLLLVNRRYQYIWEAPKP